MHLSFLTRLNFLMRPTHHLLPTLRSFRSLRCSQMHRLIPMRLTHRSLLKLPKSHWLLNYQSCRSLPTLRLIQNFLSCLMIRLILSFLMLRWPRWLRSHLKHLSFQTLLIPPMRPMRHWLPTILSFRLLRCCLMHRSNLTLPTHRSRHLLRSFPSFPMLRWPHWLR